MEFSNYLIAFFLALIATSCVNDCHLVDCAPDLFFNVAVLDEDTNLSIISDTSTFYKVDEMTITSNNNGETIIGSVDKFSTAQDGLFRLSVIINVDPSLLFLKLNGTDTDTLRFVSQFVEGECCDTYMLDSVSVNGGPMEVLDGDLVTIFK